MNAVSTINLYQALLAEGYKLPDNCRDVTLSLPAGDCIQLHYTIIVSGDDLVKVGRALVRLGAEQEVSK